MTDSIKHSPNSPILLTASLHVDEARKAISGLVNELLLESRKLNNASDIELVTLDQAINRILAEDLLSPIDVAAAENSAMDGFAFNGD
jgi:molybdopterin molybdotransferase